LIDFAVSKERKAYLQPGLVSVMMPAYNAETYIGMAIESVIAQSYPHWELVIVNDGSSDRTEEIASQYMDPRIRILGQKNQGEAAARNTALNNIQGEFLAFLDADDLYLPHHLEMLSGFLLSHENVDGVYSDGYYIDQRGNHLQTLSSRRRGPFEGRLFEQVVYGSDVFGPPACVILRTNLIYENDLKFDEKIIIGPDWDFFMKYAALAEFKYIDELTCLYRLHTTNISVRVGLEKRALELAKCRINAIQMDAFATCSIGIQTAVFYDLLANLLLDFPARQSEIIQSNQFLRLPKSERAKLLRLMASKTILHGKDQTRVRDWLHQARSSDPGDWRAVFMSLLVDIDPRLLAWVLRRKNGQEIDPRLIPPFGDMKRLSDS
jgi:glycosyltransferase involved in cell wall biosynthesis